MKIKFIEVGRLKRSWESECDAKSVDELEYDWLWSQVKKNASVMSNELEFLLSKGNMSEGIICAGFHTIGKFQIVN